MWPGGAVFSELSDTTELRITVKCPGVFERHSLIITLLPQFTTSSQAWPGSAQGPGAQQRTLALGTCLYCNYQGKLTGSSHCKSVT